jgi:hypothetical protein
MPNVQTAQAEFDGTQSLDGDFPYVDVTWDEAYAAAADYLVLLGMSADGPVHCWIKDGTKTTTGCRVLAVDHFTGTVALTAVPV